MFLRAPCSLPVLNPETNTWSVETREYATANEFFDPSINKCFSTNGSVAPGALLCILKALYTRENLQANASALVNRSILALYPSLWMEFPEDKLWLLPYFTSYGRSWSFTRPRSRGTNTLGYDDSGVNAATVSSIAAALPLIFSSHSYEEVFTRPAPGSAIQTFYLGEAPGSVAWMFCQEYIFNHRVFEKDGNQFKPSEIPAGEFRVVFSTNDGTRLRIIPIVSNQARQYLYRQFSYSANVVEILSDITSTRKVDQTRTLYGIELECSTDHTWQELIDAQHEVFMIAKQDSSISGSKSNAAELVTIPMSLQEHRVAWAKFFKSLGYEKFDCSKDTNNGLHVHVGLSAFSLGKDRSEDSWSGRSLPENGHLQRFVWFFTNPANQEFFLKMSERTQDSINRWCPLPNYSGMTPAKAYKSAVNTTKRTGRCICNLGSRHPTVEIRLFKGIVSLATVFKAIELVDSIVEFTRQVPFQKNTLVEYFKWLESTAKNQYSTLKVAVSRLTTADLVINSEVVTLAQGKKNPADILMSLSNSGIVQSNSLVTALNRHFGKRVFVFKNGAIQLFSKPGGMLSDLDKAIEALYTTHKNMKDTSKEEKGSRNSTCA